MHLRKFVIPDLRDRIKSTQVIPALVSLVVLANGFGSPLHNWDELPYAYLAAHRECYKSQITSFYAQLSSAVSDDVFSMLIDAEGTYEYRVYTDSNYFCQNLPFYSAKRLYIYLSRVIFSFTGNALNALRLLSAIPASLLSLILVRLVAKTSTIAWGGKVLLGWLVADSTTNLATLSTPDALSTFLIVVGTLSFVAQGGLDRPVTTSVLSLPKSLCFLVPKTMPPIGWILGAVFSGLSISVRPNLAMAVLCLIATLVATHRLSTKHAVQATVVTVVTTTLVNHQLSGIVQGLPDSYSLLTFMMFLAGGLFGVSGPIDANIREIGWGEVLTSPLFYAPFFFNYFNACVDSLASAFGQIFQLGFFIAVGTVRVRKILDGFRLKIYLTYATTYPFLVLSLGYSLQQFLFPLTDMRLWSPYLYLILSLCFCV